MGDRSTYIYEVQRHIAPRARLPLVSGSLTLAQLMRQKFDADRLPHGVHVHVQG